jgi:hypothetical protein
VWLVYDIDEEGHMTQVAEEDQVVQHATFLKVCVLA